MSLTKEERKLRSLASQQAQLDTLYLNGFMDFDKTTKAEVHAAPRPLERRTRKIALSVSGVLPAPT